MTIRLFEEPGEADELSQQVRVSIAARLFYLAWASMVAFLPALAATYSAFHVVNLFRSMKDAESASAERILTQLHILNTPLVIALAVSAFLAFGIALVLALEPKRRSASVGLPFSIGVPILAATPGFFLWFAETTVIDLLSGNPTNTPVAVIAQTVSLLLFCALGSALFVQVATFACAIVSLCIPAQSRTDAFSLQRVFIWAVTGTLLLAFAGAYFVLV